LAFAQNIQFALTAVEGRHMCPQEAKIEGTPNHQFSGGVDKPSNKVPTLANASAIANNNMKMAR